MRNSASRLPDRDADSHLDGDPLLRVEAPEKIKSARLLIPLDPINMDTLNTTLKEIQMSIAPYGDQQAAADFLKLISCRNILSNVVRNIESMRKASYCRDMFSVIVTHPTRPNLARMVSIFCNDIVALAEDFEIFLTHLSSKLKRSDNIIFPGRLQSLYHIYSNTEGLRLKCESLMSKIYPDYQWAESDRRFSMTSLVHILDFALISYVGAHLPRDWLPAKVVAVPSNTGLPEFYFKQRSFKCLGNFLSGRKAWVCHKAPYEKPSSIASKSFEPDLYLATDAATFADIWGPMWSEKESVDSNQILRYRVGSGVLVAWKSDGEASRAGNDNSIDSSLLKSNDRLCHWISDKDYDLDYHRNLVSEEPLRSDDILVIGAGEILKPNIDCTCNRLATKQRLRDGGFLHEPQTSNKRRYIESETVLAQVGWSGVSAGLQINY